MQTLCDERYGPTHNLKNYCNVQGMIFIQNRKVCSKIIRIMKDIYTVSNTDYSVFVNEHTNALQSTKNTKIQSLIPLIK